MAIVIEKKKILQYRRASGGSENNALDNPSLDKTRETYTNHRE
jgi:hypothetical protein